MLKKWVLCDFVHRSDPNLWMHTASQRQKLKSKVVPVHSMETYGVPEVYLHAFLTFNSE
jgi:hypothetical protein